MSYFGTDGIRGKFGVLPITPEFAFKVRLCRRESFKTPQ